jgi:predicted Zn-dependent peptidase
LKRTPETINKVFAIYQSITPQDIQATAKQYFTPANRTIVTLTSKGAAK